MPILEPKPTGGHCAKATLNGVLVTFHLTPLGQKKLLDAGVVPGRKFPLALLADLARQGHAWTSRRVAEKTGLNWVPQYDLDFEGDDQAARLFLACDDCGGYEDLHLVTWGAGDAVRAGIVCADCRASLQEQTGLSIPLPVVSATALGQLEAQGKVRATDAVVVRLRESVARDLSASWEAYRNQRESRQADFGFTNPGELVLG